MTTYYYVALILDREDMLQPLGSVLNGQRFHWLYCGTSFDAAKLAVTKYRHEQIRLAVEEPYRGVIEKPISEWCLE